MATVANPPEFSDRGIKPMPTGVAQPPKAAQTRALARQIARKGIKDPAGTTVFEPDEETALALARPWLYPEQVAGQFERPQVKHVDAGELFLVRGSVLLTRLIPSPLNSRARAKVHIPNARADGRVAVPWGPTDLQADPSCDHRLLFNAIDIEELVSSARDTASIVEGMQASLSDMIGREGIEEDLLLAPARWQLDSGTIASTSTVVAIDGGSRATLAHGELARAAASLLDNDSHLSPKRRKALEELRAALDGRLPGLLVEDATAERDLRDQLERLLTEPADRLLRTGMYRAPRLLVAPAALVIGFRPYASGSTVLDAVQQLIGNLHKRGPKQWEAAAQASDTRDEVIRALRSNGDISDADLYLLGPRYQEAAERYDKPAEPDYRIGEIVRLWYDNGPRTDAARRATRAAMRKAQLRRASLAPVLSAAVLEQLSGGDRDSVQSTLNDLFANAPICPTNPAGFPARVVDPGVLVEEAEAELQAESRGTACAELVTKGGVALALLGALTRPFGAKGDDRPYAVLERMLSHREGRRLMAQAILDLRAGRQTLVRYQPGTTEPETYLGTGEPEAWSTQMLIEAFPTAHQAVSKAAPTEAELVVKMNALVNGDGGLRELVSDLKELPMVKRQGLSGVLGGELKTGLSELAEDLGYLIRAHEEHFSASPAPEPREGDPDDEDEDELPLGVSA